MKRFISIILSIATISAVLLSTAVSTSAYKFGDLNGDGKINAADSNLIGQLILGKSSTALAKKVGDLNSDLKVNAADANLVALYFVGKYDLKGQNFKTEKITINGRDFSEYVIECPENADPCMRYAAETLAKHLGDATGIVPEIVCEAGDGPALKLMIDETAKDGNPGVLDKEAYHIYSTDTGITFEGGIYSGCMHAVYDFLYKYIGYRYYYDRDNPTGNSIDGAQRFIYASEGIVLDDIDDAHYPAVGTRNSTGTGAMRSPALHVNYGYGASSSAVYGLYGMNTSTCHGYQRWITEAEMNERNWGLAYSRQPCFTNPGLNQLLISRILDNLDARVAAGETVGKDICGVDVSQIDSPNFCTTCRTCRNIILQDGSNSGPVITFANQVSAAINERPEYKNKINVNVFAYWGTEKAPKVTRPTEMVCVSFTFYPIFEFGGVEPCNNHAIDDPDCPSNAKYNQLFEEWCAICDNISVWYYPLSGKYMANTTIFTFNLYDDIRYLAAHDVYEVYICSNEDIYDFTYINTYLIERLLWDCDMTREEFTDMIKEELSLMYGDAAEYIWEYICIMEEAADRAPGNNGQGCFFGYLTAPTECLSFSYIKEKGERLLELRELALENSGEHYDTINTLTFSIPYLYCCANHTSMWLKGDESQRARYKALIDDFAKGAAAAKCIIAVDFYNYKDINIDPNKEIDYDENPLMWMIDMQYESDKTNQLNEGALSWVGWTYDFDF